MPGSYRLGYRLGLAGTQERLLSSRALTVYSVTHMSHILAIDQGTTSSRALVFDGSFAVRGLGSQEFPQHFPASGWVEHDPEDIWATTLATARTAMAKAGLTASVIAAIGITNQRETCVLWDRRTGKALHRAIVWQDRRTADACQRLKADGAEAMVAAKTGLLLDPYFSGTKIAWLLDHVEGARAAAEAGHLAVGTIDTFLLWRLTSGRVHATDATNASRTMLTTFTPANGTTICCGCSAYPERFYLTCAIAAPITV